MLFWVLTMNGELLTGLLFLMAAVPSWLLALPDRIVNTDCDAVQTPLILWAAVGMLGLIQFTAAAFTVGAAAVFFSAKLFLQRHVLNVAPARASRPLDDDRHA